MKKVLFLIGGLLSSMVINAQVISYSDAAILFSGEENNGTARFNAMGGAFGSLGGDLSAGLINPAGLAVFNHNSFSGSLNLRDTDITTSYGGVNNLNNNNYFNLNQLGAVLVFNGSGGSSFQKIAVAFNYSISKDYENSWYASGNSGTTPITDFYDPNVEYEFAEEQTFQNYTDGRNEKFVLSFSAQPNEKLYIGASITTNDLSYYQLVYADEFNNDGNGNTFDVSASEELLTVGTGFSLGFGLIAKPIQEVRLGLAIQSPTWYKLSEEQTLYDDVLYYNGTPDIERGVSEVNIFDYNLSTPTKLTGSFAYLFGRDGLISFDYTYKNFKNLKLKPTNTFSGENQDFDSLLKATSNFKIGGEWRLGNVSLRGGYLFEESPYKDAIDTDNLTGYSLGIGFNFKGRLKLDFAYQNTKNTDVYNFLNVSGSEPAELDITNDKFTATLTFGL